VEAGELEDRGWTESGEANIRGGGCRGEVSIAGLGGFLGDNSGGDIII